ncbi:DEAD/DEAH box helicase [Hujiaoplasma nucleasis]|uniref:DEAD/DEAH box helicase n=1 Tax=Hujiaoplasma nucleasis TaxID=2725268 RepID=A0A7L6N322_9MOLU|nr:DEAD/DEAH box helicase [Hujiaoplasma nucleasis]QLY40676.1 DEAD/DEAH box helicase [Hujiaoplasma nucleasis]
MNYKNKLIEQALTQMGFEEFTEIQAKAMPLIEEGKDIIGHSQTGTGKTAAFALPLLDRIDYENQNIQSIIICPTRELAVQVKSEIDSMGQYLPKLKTVAIYGGEAITIQIKSLKYKPQVIIGTPGRIIDLMKRKLIKLHDISYLVLDEADEMLKMGFIEDIETILEQTNPERQTVMFSATMPKRIIDITKKYMNNPELVSVVTGEEPNEDITQYYYLIQDKHKIEGITRLLHVYNPNLTLVFCNTKRKVDDVTRELSKKGYNVNKIHGDLKQTNRLQVLDSFHNGELDILVATDVAARGLDIKNVEVVINYDVPEKAEYYVHRIGRTGRIGNKGYSFTLVSKREMSRIDIIQNFTKTKIKKRKIPTPDTVLKIKQEHQIYDIEQIIEHINLSPYLDTATLLLESKEPVEIISALLHKIDKNQVTEKVEGDINEDFTSKGNSRSQSRTSSRSSNPRVKGDSQRYHLNVGSESGLTPKQLVNFIIKKTKLSNFDINDVSVSKQASFFNVPSRHHDMVMSALANINLSGINTSVQMAKPTKRRY